MRSFSCLVLLHRSYHHRFSGWARGLFPSHQTHSCSAEVRPLCNTLTCPYSTWLLLEPKRGAPERTSFAQHGLADLLGRSLPRVPRHRFPTARIRVFLADGAAWELLWGLVEPCAVL